MGILSWIVFGLIAGMVARALMPGSDKAGWIVTTLLGVAGAVIGGMIGTAIGYGDVTGFNVRSFGIAVAGAFVLLIGRRMLMGNKT